MKFVVVAAPERPAIIGKNGLYYEFTFIWYFLKLETIEDLNHLNALLLT